MSEGERERFEALAKGLMAVPKREADKEAKKYQRKKKLRLARKRSENEGQAESAPKLN